MKEPKRRHSLSGAVLIMILTVMAVLIIILMTTLTVVTTANQRIYTKFEENQAYYSARSALDIFTAKMLSDADYYSYGTSGVRQYYYTDSDGNEAQADMKQGLALQGEIYKIKSKGETTAKIAKSLDSTLSDSDAKKALSFAENIEIGDDVFGGSTPEDSFFSIDGDRTDGNGIDYIEYTITLPELNDGSDAYGRMSDGNTAKIRIEVLDRVYNMVPEYSREDLIDKIKNNNPTDITAIKNAIKNGDRTKDDLRIKITATTELMGVEGTAVLILNSYSVPQVSSSRAVTSLSDVQKGDTLVMVGGASSITSGFTFHNTGTVVDDVFAIGSFEDGASQVSAHLIDDDTSFITMSSFKLSQVYPAIEGNGGFIYAYDSIELTKADNIVGADPASPDPNHGLNLITPGNFPIVATPPKIFANVYAGTINMTGTGNGKDVFMGKAYTNKLVVSSGAVTPDSSSLTFSSDGNAWPKWVQGTLNVADTLDIDTNWDGIADRSFRINGVNAIEVTGGVTGGSYTLVNCPSNITFDSSKAVKVDYFDSTHYGAALTADLEKEFTLPDTLAGSSGKNTISIPTIQSLYGDYFDVSYFKEESTAPGHGGEFTFVSIDQLKTAAAKTLTGDTSDRDTIQGQVSANIITAEDKFGSPLDSISNLVKRADLELKANDGSDDDFDFQINRVIRSDCMLESGDYSAGGEVIAIDARTNNIVIQLGDGSSNNFKLQGKFVIYGDKNVAIVLPPAKDGSGSPITYDFDTTEGKGLYIVDNRLIDINTMSGSGITLSLGDGGTSPAPNVDIYAGENANISLGTKGFITGYVYAPQSRFTIAGGANGVSYNFNYSGKNLATPVGHSSSGSPASFNVIGSILCLSYDSAQKTGVCYISRDVNTLAAGEPILNWRGYQYARY